jgi:hypothetical protein
MIVMITASTPSLKASRRPVSDSPGSVVFPAGHHPTGVAYRPAQGRRLSGFRTARMRTIRPPSMPEASTAAVTTHPSS